MRKYIQGINSLMFQVIFLDKFKMKFPGKLFYAAIMKLKKK